MHGWEIGVEKRNLRIKGKQVPLFLIRISGSLDAYTFPKLEEALRNLYEGGNYHMVLNMEKLNYISSAGLGVLMSTARTVRDNAGDIRICNLPPKIHGIMDLLGFTTVFQIYKSEEDAAFSFVQEGKGRT